MSMSVIFLHTSPLYVSMLNAVTQMEVISVSVILASYLMAAIIVWVKETVIHKHVSPYS